MVKFIFLLFTFILLIICVSSRCEYGCFCSNDDSCTYYCQDSTCQRATSLWKKCFDHNIHPRQCGPAAYCDPLSNYTCQLQKNYGEYCKFSYSCLSEYCELKSNSCQTKPADISWLLFSFIPIILTMFIFLLIFIVFAVRKERQQRLAYVRNLCNNISRSALYPCQNSYIVRETLPPPYPGISLNQQPPPYSN